MKKSLTTMLHTGDPVVDHLIRELDTIARNYESPTTVQGPYTYQHLDNMIIAVIRILEIFPASVKKHFCDLPTPYIAGAHYDWDAETRVLWMTNMATGLRKALTSCETDNTLKREANPTFPDRPKTVGERLEHAGLQFYNELDRKSLTVLERVAAETHLKANVRNIRLLLGRGLSPITLQTLVSKEVYKIEKGAKAYYNQRI